MRHLNWAHIDLSFVRTGFIEDNPFGVASFDLKSLFMAINRDWNWLKTKKSQLPKLYIPNLEFTHLTIEDARWQQRAHFIAASLIGAEYYVSIAYNNNQL